MSHFTEITILCFHVTILLTRAMNGENAVKKKKELAFTQLIASILTNNDRLRNRLMNQWELIDNQVYKEFVTPREI